DLSGAAERLDRLAVDSRPDAPRVAEADPEPAARLEAPGLALLDQPAEERPLGSLDLRPGILVELEHEGDDRGAGRLSRSGRRRRETGSRAAAPRVWARSTP